MLAPRLLVLVSRQGDGAGQCTVTLRFLSPLLLALSLLSIGRADAQAVHSLDTVSDAAVNAVRAQLPSLSRGKYFISATALDSRLRLAPCTTPLVANVTTASGAAPRRTVGVHCQSGSQWTVYVPVSIEVELPVLVLQRSLGRDARVNASDVQVQTRRVAGLATNFASDLSQLQGRHLKRPLAAGASLTMDALVVDVLVRRGQQVTLLASSGSIEIRAQGRALSEGGVSDRIRVQNVNSLKIVEGVVKDAGTVQVSL